MLRFIYLFTLCFLLATCTSPYLKADQGYEYRIISLGKGEKPVYGNFVQFHMTQSYKNGRKDTLLGDSREYMPRIEKLDSMNLPPLYLKVFSEARKGDSIVIRILTDSAYKEYVNPMPKYMNSAGYVYTTIKILNIFEKRYDADSSNRAELRKNSLKIYNKQLVKFEKDIEKNKAQIDADSKVISNFLEKHNIRTIRGKWGTFIAIHEMGNGKKILYNDVVAVNYTGKTFDSGKVFNSSVDPKFNNLGTYEVTMRNLGSVIPGWTDALMELRNGAKATLYIPSSLAYGQKSMFSSIKPNENIIYDIEIVNVITEDRAMEIMSENRIKADEANRKMEESLQKEKLKKLIFK